VARGGPKYSHVAGRDEVEIGWTVVPERWRQGLATDCMGWSHVLYRKRAPG
jgi:hypothetical protein